MELEAFASIGAGINHPRSSGCKHAGLPEPGLISIYTVCGTEYYLLSISAFWRNG